MLWATKFPSVLVHIYWPIFFFLFSFFIALHGLFFKSLWYILLSNLLSRATDREYSMPPLFFFSLCLVIFIWWGKHNHHRSNKILKAFHVCHRGNLAKLDGVEHRIHVIKKSLLSCLYDWMIDLGNIPCHLLDFIVFIYAYIQKCMEPS